MSYIEISSVDFGFPDPSRMKDKGKELCQSYRTAAPFPHIVIDDFLTPAALEVCLEEFPAAPDPDSLSFDRAQERYKTSFNPDYLAPRARSFFYSMNSRPFVEFLKNLSGIKGLIPDPYFIGGGFHETRQGGHLSVHADFNLHPELNLERRLNLLIYLNKDWRMDYGGGLELWDRTMKTCARKVEPLFNRCVVFSTSATSYHGHPDPVAHPKGEPRRSIALYYYTATHDGTQRAFDTQFKTRPKSADAVDWRIKSDELLADFLPPIVMRNVRRAARRLKRPN